MIATTKLISPLNLRAAYLLLAAALLIVNCRAQSSAPIAPTNNQAAVEPTPAPIRPASKVKFSSVYTKLNSKTCQPIAKAESPEDEIPLICEGFQGYKIFLGEHGANPPMYVGREISTNMDSWNPADFPVINGVGMGQTIEWRLADGEPFAFIVRVEYDKAILDPDAKGKVKELAVRNLKGFAPISAAVDAKKNKRANEAARRAADKGYGKL